MTDNQDVLQENFQAIFTSLTTLGHNVDNLIDCSEVIPASKPANFGPAQFPAGKTMDDVEQAVGFQLFACSFVKSDISDFSAQTLLSPHSPQRPVLPHQLPKCRLPSHVLVLAAYHVAPIVPHLECSHTAPYT